MLMSTKRFCSKKFIWDDTNILNLKDTKIYFPLVATPGFPGVDREDIITAIIGRFVHGRFSVVTFNR